MTAADVLPNAILESPNTSPAEVVISEPTVQDPTPRSNTSGTSPSSAPPPPSPLSIQEPDEFSSCDGLLLSKELINLELQARETVTGEIGGSAPDPSYLLTPPDTPNIIDHCDLVKAYQDKWLKGDCDTPPWSSSVDDEGTPQPVFPAFLVSLLVCSFKKTELRL